MGWDSGQAEQSAKVVLLVKGQSDWFIALHEDSHKVLDQAIAKVTIRYRPRLAKTDGQGLSVSNLPTRDKCIPSSMV